MGLEARNEALANRDACVVIVQGVEAIVWIDPRGLGSMNSFLPHESSNPLRGRGLEVVIDLAKKNAWARRNKSTLQTSQVGKSRSHYLLFSLQLILPLHTSSYKLIRAKLGAGLSSRGDPMDLGADRPKNESVIGLSSQS